MRQARAEVEARAVELEGDDAEARRPTEALAKARGRPRAGQRAGVARCARSQGRQAGQGGPCEAEPVKHACSPHRVPAAGCCRSAAQGRGARVRVSGRLTLGARAQALAAKGAATPAEVRTVVEDMDMRGRKALGARLVARAWADAGFRARLLADAAAAAEELGIASSNFPPAPGAPRMHLTLTLALFPLPGAPSPRRARCPAPPPARRLAGASGSRPPVRAPRRPRSAWRAGLRRRSRGPAFGSCHSSCCPRCMSSHLYNKRRRDTM